MISRIKANRLLSKDSHIYASAPILHGTSIEAVSQMLGGERLPPGGGRPTNPNRNWLYFIPNKDGFRGHPLYDSIQHQDVEQAARDYARLAQQKIYLERVLGSDTEIVFSDFEIPGFLDRLSRVDREKIEKEGLNKMLEHATQLNGVGLAIKPCALKELDLEVGRGENPGYEIRVNLPQGLDAKYIASIQPFGDMEKRAIDFLIRLNLR